MPGITQYAESFYNAVISLMNKVDVCGEKIEMMKPELTELVEDHCERMTRIEEDVKIQKELTTKLIQRIGFLEKKIKQSVSAERRRDYNQVRNNLLVRSKKSIPDIRKYLANAVELGGGAKVT